MKDAVRARMKHIIFTPKIDLKRGKSNLVSGVEKTDASRAICLLIVRAAAFWAARVRSITGLFEVLSYMAAVAESGNLKHLLSGASMSGTR